MINTVVLTGRITKDIQIRMTQQNRKTASFTLAVNRGKDTADFISCVAWEEVADLMAQYTHKGSQIGIEGRLHTRTYDDPNFSGRKVYVTEVWVSNVTFLDPKEESGTAPRIEKPYGEPVKVSSDDLPF